MKEVISSGLVGKDGVNFNIKMDTQTIIILTASIFGAVTLGVIIARLITKNV